MYTDGPVELMLAELFTAQKFAVLSTMEQDGPYASLMAFAATPDLKTMVFATDRSSRKFINLAAHAHIAVLIDNRSNQSSDTENAIAVTALGLAHEVTNDEHEELLAVYLDKHPHLADFTRLSSCVLVCMQVQIYRVCGFRSVRELKISSAQAL